MVSFFFESGFARMGRAAYLTAARNRNLLYVPSARSSIQPFKTGFFFDFTSQK